MNKNSEQEIFKILKDIWYNICILERDYGIEYIGYMTNILKFTIQCIADKYGIDLKLDKGKKCQN